MDGILDFSKEIDVGLLDRVVNAFFSGVGPEQQMAQQTLTQFQEHPDAWQRVDAILDRSENLQTKYIALQVLEKLVQTRWKILPMEQRQGIRNYIVSVIIKVSSEETSFNRQKMYINKLNMVLVQILKQEWPKHWPSFIPEIVSSSKTNLTLCENNMAILKLLSEEIFDYSAEQLVSAKAKNLKDQLNGEFSEIFNLCSEVLGRATKPSLIKATLETLLRFLNWIPLGYIFETDLIRNLQTRFLGEPAFRNVTLKCLTEIGGLQVGPEYNNAFLGLFNVTIQEISKMIPPNTNIAGVYTNSSDEDQEFIQNLALFITNFLGVHLKLIENQDNKEPLLQAHFYLIEISQVEERELFKICLEYWSKLVAELYEELSGSQPDVPFLNLGGRSFASAGVNAVNARKQTYATVLTRLRWVMIERMVKPEEVLVVENDEGEIVRETLKESDTVTLYKSMKECLVYLTHLDVYNTEQIMSEKLAKQMDGSEWSWANLNTLCWAIGSISGSMSEDTEKRFLVTVIKDLLNLVEMKRGKDNKAVVASNIMYIVGQYPRFLKAHWKFLKTVVNKLFEFMHETHEGVQDMACDTIIKIAQKCKRHFVMQQAGEVRPFIDEILETMDRITSDLSPQQMHTFYEAVGTMVSAQVQKPVQERLVMKMMEMPNSAWDSLIAQAAQNIAILDNPENIKILANIIKTNVAACSAVGAGFFVQLSKIFMDLLGLYKTVSERISALITEQGMIATKTPKVRGMRTVKKEALRLVDTYIQKAEDLPTVTQTMIPPLFDCVLGDYQRNIEPARDAEVLNVMSSIVNRLGALLTDRVITILNAVFEPTLNMINKDFTEYPEHRVGFYKLLRAINQQCFPALLTLPQLQFKLFMDSVVWGFKHTMRDIADMGLDICDEVIANVAASDPNIANAFYQSFFLSILQDVFFVLTDTDHKSGFKRQTVVLARLFNLASSGAIQAPLFTPQQVSNPNMSNVDFLREYVTNLLQNAFPHLQPVQIQVFGTGLMEYNTDPTRFKLHVRDFLIQLKEFAGDTSDLYLDEKEAELERKKKEDMEKALQVPGLLKPSEMPTMEQDD
ncbi:Exportin-1 [Bifiguratus adelaidae]|uniref:Exportin-1 n=1 Tax=Bifiguratus adelaidae TaxID=1938954 RepID=A0A261Y3E1_9FUNG|nr:Exportin-1 [Bifiguratus adelaidae]